MKRLFLLTDLMLLGLLCAAPVRAQGPQVPKAQMSLVTAKKTIAPGETVTVALHQVIPPNWHTYWVNPGDSGVATSIGWQVPDGWKAGAITWPYPARFPAGPEMTFGYTGDAVLLTQVTAPKDAAPGQTAMLGADVKWLQCSDSLCVPEEAHLTLPVAIAAAPSPPDADEASFFAAARAKLPSASPWPALFDADAKRFALLVQSPALAKGTREAVFYPAEDGFAAASAPQRVGTSPRGLVLESTAGWKMASDDKRKAAGDLTGVLVLTGADGQTQALAIDAPPGAIPSTEALFAQSAGLSVVGAVLFAFLGGLILNLMPCVFPVLSMKALALAAKAGAPEKAKAAALAYGAGVVASFLLLAGALIALRGGGAALGWGFQLQQPVFVLALALIMGAVGLNLSGLYEIGGSFAGVGSGLAASQGIKGNFFTGVLAVLVATPCTAPFMAAALGFALAASVPVALAVFLTLGVGFALPFVALGISPRLLRALPKPGLWMVRLRQWLALPMYGAALWLLWVLSQQTGWPGVIAAALAGLALGLALWIYGKASLPRGAKLSASSLAAIAVAGLAVWVGVQTPSKQALATEAMANERGALAYEPYSAARLAALRAEGRPVFVNATAAWCITCLVNERVALSSDRLKQDFTDKKIAALKADWTNQDAEITQLLASEGRSGVPLYLYFAPRAQAPVVLPQLLTEAGVIAAIDAR